MRETLLKYASVLWLLGMYIVMLATFLTAYFHPAKAVTVSINHFNEANFELAMLLVGSVLILKGIPLIFRDLERMFRERAGVRAREMFR